MTLFIYILAFIFYLCFRNHRETAISHLLNITKWWLRDNLNFTQLKFTNLHQDPRLNWANMNERILSYQNWDPLPIRGFNSWDYVRICNRDSQISNFISKWCIWDSSNVIDQSQMNFSRKDLKHAQEQTRHARMQLKASGYCDNIKECKH